jgi:SM-20-related protein
MYDDLIWQLRRSGLSVCPEFLNKEICQELQHEVLQYWRDDYFKKAGIGHGAQFTVNPGIRNDFILWLDAGIQNSAIRQYLALLEQLRLLINQELLLGLLNFEGMMAVYPEGHFYKKHTDQFQDTDMRTLTVILYLNDNWQGPEGGQLRIYNMDGEPDNCMDILPQMGTLVCFLSSRFPHEVLPATRQRMSITGWFKRRDLDRLF